MKLQHRSAVNHGSSKEVYATRATGNRIRATKQGKNSIPARENNWCGSKQLEEIGKGELQPWLNSFTEKIAIANGTSN